ncbi:MAG: hypothetical protein R3B06_20625 [Kofleriaceae bacterium]
MKLLIGLMCLAGVLAVASADQPQASVATASLEAPTAAPVPAAAPDGELVCTRGWQCDEPFGFYPTLKACRAACSVQCGWYDSCNP